jgi:hypothetical protein
MHTITVKDKDENVTTGENSVTVDVVFSDLVLSI